jgi:putative membrane protein
MMDGWDWVWGTLMMVVFWGGLTAVVVLAVRAFGSNSRRGSAESDRPDARAILDARFARGEISEEEFEDRKRALGLAVGRNGQFEGKIAGAR